MNDFQRRIGVGLRQHHYGRHVGTTNATPVTADDGPLRGHEVGHHTEHWDGRVDATVTSAVAHINPNLTARKADHQ